MSYKHILVAVDESPMSYAAVEQALELAKDLNSRVTLMSVTRLFKSLANSSACSTAA